MGCDIHLYVEFKQNERWIHNPSITYDDRNYNVFAMLANVRNGKGFAGCDTGDGFNPIAMPRGLPNNVSSIIEIESEKWGPDGHSHSYITLTELLKYDWTQKTAQRGVFDIANYTAFLKNNKKLSDGMSYSGDVWGGNVTKLTETQLEEMGLANAIQQYGLAHLYVQCQWFETYMEAASNFYDTFIPILKDAAPNQDTDRIRIVFWFDN